MTTTYTDAQATHIANMVEDRGLAPNDFRNLAANAIRTLLAERKAAIQPQGGEVSYFAADPANGDFAIYDSLAEAKAAAQRHLEYAQENAIDSGWSDDPPQICYGTVLAHCEEIPESRKPAPEGGDFTEIVDFRLSQHVHEDGDEQEKQP